MGRGQDTARRLHLITVDGIKSVAGHVFFDFAQEIARRSLRSCDPMKKTLNLDQLLRRSLVAIAIAGLASGTASPVVRLADRFAVVLLAVTIAIAAVAWLISGDLVRSLAVFVAATPCPLILAAPVAFIAGVAHAPALRCPYGDTYCSSTPRTFPLFGLTK